MREIMKEHFEKIKEIFERYRDEENIEIEFRLGWKSSSALGKGGKVFNTDIQSWQTTSRSAIPFHQSLASVIIISKSRLIFIYHQGHHNIF